MLLAVSPVPWGWSIYFLTPAILNAVNYFTFSKVEEATNIFSKE
jgi:hypothetical protein